MKRTIRLAALAAVSATLVAAPLTAQTTLSARAGVSIATISGDELGDADSRTGLHVGAALTLPLSGAVGVQVGAAYTQKGATVDIDGDEPGSATLAVDYIEIPVLLSFGVPTQGSISPRFYFGPAVSFETSCEIQAEALGMSASIDCSAGEIDTKSVTFGALAGAGIDIATSGNLTITLDVAYNLGLTDIDDSPDPADSKNRALTILGGVSFPLGG
jgi:hypothetical protein